MNTAPPIYLDAVDGRKEAQKPREKGAESLTTDSEPLNTDFMNDDPLTWPETAMNGAPLTCTGTLIAIKAQSRLESWLRLCAGNGELLANYDRLRGTNLAGRGTPIDRLIDEATGKLEEEALGFFDWCREMFDRLGWEKEAVDG